MFAGMESLGGGGDINVAAAALGHGSGEHDAGYDSGRNTEDSAVSSSISLAGQQPRRKSTQALAAEWNPSYQGEDIYWYTEYIARHAPISMKWLYPGDSMKAERNDDKEIKGLGVFRGASYGSSDLIVSPLNDGTVCVWDLGRLKSRDCRGPLRPLSHSKPGILFSKDDRSDKADGNEFLDTGDCVSIESIHQQAYVAVGGTLNQIDLSTLQVVAQQRFEKPIFALSQEDSGYFAPLSVVAYDHLCIYDPRCRSSSSATLSGLTHDTPASGRSPFLSVLHPPLPNAHSIIAAGRFPSLILHDRRNLSRIQGTAYSGGNLSCLTAIPGQLDKSERTDGRNKHIIIACGEYRGRGSLELYGLSAFDGAESTSSAHTAAMTPEAFLRNRQNTSASKLLSCASHGSRIAFSDSSGYVTWMERDGRTPSRQFHLAAYMLDRRKAEAQEKSRRLQAQQARRQQMRNIAGPSPPPSSSASSRKSHDDNMAGLPPDLGRLGNSLASGMELIHDPLEPAAEDMREVEAEMSRRSDVARKILPLATTAGEGHAVDVLDDGLLIWTGEEVGLLRFGVKNQESTKNEDEDDEEGTGDVGDVGDEEEMRHRDYERMIMRSWRNYTNELHLMRNFGGM